MKVIQSKRIDNVIKQLDIAVDLDSTKKMLAFQYFNNDMNALTDYLSETNYHQSRTCTFIEPKAQLELSF